MKKKVLIVNRAQYGYHVDPYKYCEYLKDKFNITHIGWDYGLQKVQSEGITVKYISRQGNKIARYYRFLKEVNKEIRTNEYDVIFMIYFAASSLIRLLNQGKTFNIDIRTAADTKNRVRNYLKDLLLKVECTAFKNITIVSESLAESLALKNYHFLPLGGECFYSGVKSYSKLHLLYVGTLENRNLIECIKGFHAYLKNVREKDKIETLFTIIGDSPGTELHEINEYIGRNNLSEVIRTLGYIHNYRLHRFFEEANIGVSFVPMTKYYDNQPPTKTYEYLLSGLPVIATKTKENSKILTNGDCGVLIDDNAGSFAAGLKKIAVNREIFNSEQIRNSYRENLWSNIVLNKLKPYLDKLSNNNIPSVHKEISSIYENTVCN